MGVVIACSVLLVLGLIATARWASLDVSVPDGPASVSFAIRRYVWSVSLFLWTTLLVGVLVAGPAARLAMRLLAVTAGGAAQGRKTEAEEIVGRISIDGTIGLFIFGGVAAAFMAALAFLVLRRWLPRGRAGGAVLGAILLVTLATRIDPLRAENVDFDIVGPAWVSIGVYAVMALVVGSAVVAIAGRLSRFLPVPGKSVRTLAPHVVVLLLIPAFFVAVPVVIVGFVTVLASRTELPEILASKRALLAGRVVLAAVVVAALPGFVSAIASIAGRGP